MLFNKLAPLALAGFVAATPIGMNKRQLVSKDNVTDVDILQYALTLEHLEAAFYKQSLDMYNAGAFDDAGLPEWVRERFTEIASHEHTHVDFLTSALSGVGADPVAACTYDFGVTSPATFLATAQVLEGVGVSAYLGAAPSIKTPAYLSLAGAILVVEAQHQTWVRSGADNEDGFPRAFAAPLDFSQVYTLAAPFITSCPSTNAALPVKAFPAVTVNTEGPYKVGQKVSITQPKGLSGDVYAAFVQATGTTFQLLNSTTDSVTIPMGITGQSYLVLTSGPTVTDSSTLAGPAVFEIPVPATDFDYSS